MWPRLFGLIIIAPDILARPKKFWNLLLGNFHFKMVKIKAAYKEPGVMLALRLSPEERVGCDHCSRGFCAVEICIIWWMCEVASTEAQGLEMCCMHRHILSPQDNLSRALSQHRMLTLKPYNNFRHVHVFSHPLCLDDLYCEKDWAEYHSHSSILWHWVENI